MNFDAALRSLLERAAGVRGCVLLDPDGILLGSALAGPEINGEDLGARCSLLLRELATVTPRLGGGPLRASILDAEGGSLVLVPLRGNYGLVLLLEQDGNLGQALFEARKVGFALNVALA